MAKKRKLSGFKKGTYVEADLYTSAAYLSLKGVASQLLLLMMGKRDRGDVPDRHGKMVKGWTNLNHIIMTYKELSALGISQPRGTRGFDELLAKGFITIKHHGGARQQDKTIYGLIEKWRIWIPGKVFETRPKDARRGYQGKNKKTKVVELGR